MKHLHHLSNFTVDVSRLLDFSMNTFSDTCFQNTSGFVGIPKLSGGSLLTGNVQMTVD